MKIKENCKTHPKSLGMLTIQHGLNDLPPEIAVIAAIEVSAKTTANDHFRNLNDYDVGAMV